MKRAYFIFILILLGVVGGLVLNANAEIANEVLFEVHGSFSDYWLPTYWQTRVWGWGSFTVPDRIAVEYTPASAQTVCTAKTYISRSSGTSYDLILSVYEGGLKPESGSLIGRKTIPGTAVPTQFAIYTAFNFDNCLNLKKNTTYWFTWTRSQLQLWNGYYTEYRGDEYPNIKGWFYEMSGPYGWTAYSREISLRLEGYSTKEPVLIIPGIAGSELYNGDDLIWMDLEQMFQDIDDQFLDQLKLNERGLSVLEISLGNVIKRSPNFPIIDNNIFKSLEEDLLNNDYEINSDLFYLPYDWRLNLDNSKDILNAKIEEIKSQTGATKVNIIAHSMGGLLTKDYINSYGKDGIDKLIFVGTPHLGAPKAGKVLLVGDNMGIPWLRGEKIKEIAKNSPALHQLLPDQKYFDSFAGYIRKSDLTLLNYQDTKNFLINETQSPDVMGLSESFWAKNLEDADFSGVNTYNFAGCVSGTQSEYHLKNDSSIGSIDYTSGDSTVPLVSSDYINIPEDKKFYLRYAHHVEMPSQTDIRTAILDILSGDIPTVTGNLKDNSSDCYFNAKTLFWHSPVAVHIYDSLGNHTGPIDNDGIEYGVPGIDYEIIGHDKFIFLPTDTGETYSIVADGLATGSFDLLISHNNNGIVENTTVFNDVPIGESGDVNFSVSNSSLDSNINVDYYGNDAIQSVQAVSVLSGDDVNDVVFPETQASITGQPGSSGWYLGNVIIGLSATDDNSGVLETKYSLDGQPLTAYSVPINISDEGMHTVLYYSVDRAGNNEEVKTLSFGIDMTGIEISVGIDIEAGLFRFLPVSDDLNGVSFSCDLASCTAIDRAGNTTKLEFTLVPEGIQQILNLSSVSYNGTEHSIYGNQLILKLWTEDNTSKDFSQTFLVIDNKQVRLDYNEKQDESVIVYKPIVGKPTRENISGKRFLQIFTDKGKIEYIIL